MFCGVFICIHLHLFFCYCLRMTEKSAYPATLLTCKSLAASVLFPELLSFMLTHECNLFIQTVLKWFSAAKKLFLWHQSTRNCTVSLQGQGVSFYHNYYPLFVSVLLTLCWVGLGKHIQTAPSVFSHMSTDTRAALIQRACVQHLPCPGACTAGTWQNKRAVAHHGAELCSQLEWSFSTWHCRG